MFALKDAFALFGSFDRRKTGRLRLWGSRELDSMPEARLVEAAVPWDWPVGQRPLGEDSERAWDHVLPADAGQAAWAPPSPPRSHPLPFPGGTSGGLRPRRLPGASAGGVSTERPVPGVSSPPLRPG